MYNPVLQTLIHSISQGHSCSKGPLYGHKAKQFMKLAPVRSSAGKFSPPLEQKQVYTIHALLFQIGEDLTGDMSGSDEEKWLAQEWIKLKSSIKKNDLLKFYRKYVINQSTYAEDLMENIRIKEYLQLVNQYMDVNSNAQHTFHKVRRKMVSDFKKDLMLDNQAMSRYLSIAAHRRYLKKFEDAISRKNVAFLGEYAYKHIMIEISKAKGFSRQLPILMRHSKIFSHFIKNHYCCLLAA